MERRVDALEGLALSGSVRIRDLSFSVPGLLEVSRDGASVVKREPQALLSAADSPAPGRRKVVIQSDEQSILLEFPVPAPEISGVPGATYEASPGVWLLHPPLSSQTWDALRADRPELIALMNARTLLAEGEPFVFALQEIHTRLGSRPILWLPRVALPHRLALLVYLGAQLLDATETLWRADEGIFLDPTLGSVPAPVDRSSGPCACSACSQTPVGSLAEHGLLMLREELRRVRSALRSGRLRELVEARLTAEPLLAELLRNADRDLGPALEERAPVIGTGSRNYVLTESYRRPEVLRYQRRFLERYSPPPSKRILLLVPCSKTKPYRRSHSHRQFARVLEGLVPLERLHFVSVTSPFGLVPRELEDVYPVRHYDIPVTGEWSGTEQSTVRRALEYLLHSGKYTDVVAHLDPREYGFLADLLREPVVAEWTVVGDRPTSIESGTALRASVERALENCPPVESGPLSVVREELEALAGFQFGPPAARDLFRPPIRLTGRPWFQRVTDGRGQDLATWREERGLFHLTVAGGERVMAASALQVEVGADVELKGDLFCPGVAAADPTIRTGDAVTLIQRGRLVGVGEANLPGTVMTDLGHGLAVRVRHRAHPNKFLREEPTIA